MPTAAYQLPYRQEDADRVGRHLFRKQLLPVDEPIPYEGRELVFGRDDLEEIASNFNAGAMTQVPFVLATERNEHNDDPERYRGEIKGVEVDDDGLYGYIEPSDRGTELVAENPRLPVSPRIKVPEDGPFAGKPVLAHVLGTLDERAKHMKPWETVDMAKPAAGETLIDLTESSYQTRSGKDAGGVRSLLAGFFGRDADARQRSAVDDGDAALAALLTEPEQRRVTELTERQQRLEAELATERRERDRERAEAELTELARAGVPKWVRDEIRPVLEHPREAVIELSATERVDAAKVIRELVNGWPTDARLEFGEAGGSLGEGDEDAEAREAREVATTIVKEYG